MANLKEIRSRISSVNSTMQITSAMKMVSAAKLKKAQDAIIAMRPYSEKLTQLLQNLSQNVQDDFQSPFLKNREIRNTLLVTITSNRGLCGGFNSSIVKAVKERASIDDTNVSILTIGKKGNDALKKEFDIKSHYTEIYDDLSFKNSSIISEKIVEGFLDNKYDKVYLVYNKFKNAATQIVEFEQFLPLIPKAEKNIDKKDYIFEPEINKVLSSLIPKTLKIQLFKAIRDSFASEHGARMTAMHKATDNATELRDQLKLTYNKARQASITNEILEIVGGAEALKN
jgi:F-type H+-transporting ATPase subunit gamma